MDFSYYSEQEKGRTRVFAIFEGGIIPLMAFATWDELVRFRDFLGTLRESKTVPQDILRNFREHFEIE